MTHCRLLLISLLVAYACSTSSALASSAVKLAAKFEPDQLGANSTILLEFAIATPAGETPSPLVGVSFQLPSGLGVSSSTLGAATCEPAALQEHGLGGCSSNSLMGSGSAMAGVPIGPGTLDEPVKLTILMAPAVNGHTAMSFYASGSSPVIAQLVFPALLLADSGPFGASLDTSIPLIAGLPGAPNVAILSMQASIGSSGLTYHKLVHGNVVSYVPKGFAVPLHCPVGGFPFAATFTFANGASESASSKAPCPLGGGPHDARKQLRA